MRSGLALFQGPMTPRRALLLTLGVCSCLAVLGAIIIGPNLRWPQGTRGDFPEIPSTPPPGTLNDTLDEPHRATPLAWFMLGNGTRFRQAFELRPPYEPDSGTTFRSEQIAIRLAGIEAPALEAICLNTERFRWACGRQARAALYNLIRNRVLICRPRHGVQGISKAESNAIPAHCTIDGQDLATELIRTGFARSGGFPSPAQAMAEEQARAEMRGLWNGGWSILP